MAAMAGPSGRFGGGGDQPPNQPSAKKPDLSYDDTSDDSSDEGTPPFNSDSQSSQPLYSFKPDVQIECLKCPVCHNYPRLKVYQCCHGHIVCSVCIVNGTKCPECRVVYRGKKIRNLVAEALLETVTYNCSHRNCPTTNIPRNRLIAHETQCDHNPTTTALFCYQFQFKEFEEFSGACKFRICPDAIKHYPQQMSDTIAHLIGRPHNLPYERVKRGQNISILFRPPNLGDPKLKPMHVFGLYNGKTGSIIGYYLLIRNYMQDYLSWTVVRLASTPTSPNGENPRSRSDTITFLIMARREPGNLARCEDKRWVITAKYLNEWKDYLTGQQLRFAFPQSVDSLRVNYEQEDGKCKITMSFG